MTDKVIAIEYCSCRYESGYELFGLYRSKWAAAIDMNRIKYRKHLIESIDTDYDEHDTCYMTSGRIRTEDKPMYHYRYRMVTIND